MLFSRKRQIEVRPVDTWPEWMRNDPMKVANWIVTNGLRTLALDVEVTEETAADGVVRVRGGFYDEQVFGRQSTFEFTVTLGDPIRGEREP